MVQTTHGWIIPGTAHPEVDQVRARCGGLNSCPLCMEEAEQFVQNLIGKGNVMTLTMPPNIPETARKLVYHYIQRRYRDVGAEFNLELSSVHIVWFSKTLEHWKALITTELPDKMYYEVTHNGGKRETYIDAYKKFDNVCIKDGLVRIAILPPATGKVGPMWVAYGRKDAFWWALKVIRAALFGSFRETTHKG